MFCPCPNLFITAVIIGTEKYSHLMKNKTNVSDSKDSVKYTNSPPVGYVCPLSHKIMDDPVIADDSITYERSAIIEWFLTKSTSPITRKYISKKLLSNGALKSVIDSWKEKNIMVDSKDTSEHSENKITIKYKKDSIDKELICQYDDNTNGWDLVYDIYVKLGLSADEYKLKENSWASFIDKNRLVKNLKKELQLETFPEGTISLQISNNNIEYFKGYSFPKYFTVKNFLYRNTDVDSPYLCTAFRDMRETGDNMVTGNVLHHSSRLVSVVTEDTKVSIFKKRKFNHKKGNYLTRLDVVKKLFDSFVNRSIAYSFNTAIGLMSFNDSSNLECDISPFYETFRGNMDKLRTSGGTALYESLKDACTKLVAWKIADPEKRKTANLRIICLSDGASTDKKFGIKSEAERLCLQHGIILDCIAIGSEYDSYLGTISKKTGGYMFNPSSIKLSFDIMELETMVLSKGRARVSGSSYNYNNVIYETVTPPITNPDGQLHAKSKHVDIAVKRVGDYSKTIMKELLEINRNPHPDIDVYVNDTNIRFWKVIFSGPDGTPYRGGTWMAYIEFPESFPYVPPNIRFVTPIKHCNINNYGRVCHSILDRNYTPATSVSLILQCIYGLLLNPDVTDPLDTNLALSYYEADGSYEGQIIEFVNTYAKKSRTKWAAELS